MHSLFDQATGRASATLFYRGFDRPAASAVLFACVLVTSRSLFMALDGPFFLNFLVHFAVLIYAPVSTC